MKQISAIHESVFIFLKNDPCMYGLIKCFMLLLKSVARYKTGC